MTTVGNVHFNGKHANPTYLRELARELRASPTPAELKLWGRIRRKRLEGIRFRRQHIISRYIIDFFAFLHAHQSPGIAVELDGRFHDPEYDRLRNEWLAAEGYHVLRFENRQVIEDIEGVLERIRTQVNALRI